jgi:GR25 family glycosyltransferase involved in LPS biosynthesis
MDIVWLVVIMFVLNVFFIVYFIFQKRRQDSMVEKVYHDFFLEKQHVPARLDKIYYINLDRRPDRKYHFLRQCQEENIDMSLVQRFPAIDGQTLRLSEEEEQLFVNCSYQDRSYRTNIMGNQLSHYYILQDMRRNNYHYALVLQDDVVLKKNFNHYLQQVLASLPDDAEIVHIGLHKYANQSTFVPLDLENPIETLCPCHQQVNSCVCIMKDSVNPCSLAYLVTRKGALHLCEYFKRVGFRKETDWNYHVYLEKKQINYASKIVLCTGALLGSDIFPNDIK